MFKGILGDKNRKQHTISFLSSILKWKKSEFADIEFPTTELHGNNYAQKRPVVDIIVALNNGTRINIEMQAIRQSNFNVRTLYYATRLYSGQLKTSENYADLRPTISIVICDFNLEPDQFPLHDNYMNDPVIGSTYSSDLRIITLELPKRNNNVKIKSRQLSPLAKSWLGIMVAKTEEEFMANATFPETRAVLDDVKELSSSQDMRYAYLIEHMARLDHNTDIHYAKQEGLQQGEQNKQREIAQAMLKSGYDRSEVVRLTGLTPDQLT
jgi:predicted transposase/invertase (TIGR01784 family)